MGTSAPQRRRSQDSQEDGPDHPDYRLNKAQLYLSLARRKTQQLCYLTQEVTVTDQIACITANELENEPTSEDEEIARSGYNASLSCLPDGLLRKVLACGDWLVTLAPQLISNLTSNLAECYMALRTMCDGGKQYNRIQGGSFEHRCYTAGLHVQHGPQWRVKFWEETTGKPAGQVIIQTCTHADFV